MLRIEIYASKRQTPIGGRALAFENIRPANESDLSRIAEIFVFNNRVNYFPIFKDESFSFSELQVRTVLERFPDIIGSPENTYVYDDGVIKGFTVVSDKEITKLYVDTFFQSRGIGGVLISFAKKVLQAERLWVLEKNIKAIKFYESHGFIKSGGRKPEDGTDEWLTEMRKESKNA